jgi:hypothetical protein
VVDAAHGAAYHVAPDVFHELGAEVIAIGCEPDGIQHQRRLWCHISSGPGQGAVHEHGPTTASRWTAMPTGCNWSMPPAGSSTAMSCST